MCFRNYRMEVTGRDLRDGAGDGAEGGAAWRERRPVDMRLTGGIGSAGSSMRTDRDRWLGWLLLASLGVPAGRLWAQGTPVQEAIQRGALAMRNGRSADAESAFRDAVKLAPGMADAHLDLGLVLGREGKAEEAIASVRKAIELDPKLPSAHMFLGVFLYQANRREEAIGALKQELATDPKNVEALTWLGIAELADGHPEMAVEPFDRAAEMTPNDLSVLEYRGRAHSQVARDSYAKMAQISPNSWQVHKVRAELYAEDEKNAESIKEYEAAIQIEQRNPDLYEGLGDVYRKLNELEAAQKAYARELELSPSNPIAMYNLGSTAIDRGDYAAGVPLLEGMRDRYRGAAVADYYLGRGLAATGKEAEAVARLEGSAKADPEGEVAKRSYYELARIYRKLQRPTEAENALREYNRLREAQDKRNAERVQDWRKLGAAVGPSS